MIYIPKNIFIKSVLPATILFSFINVDNISAATSKKEISFLTNEYFDNAKRNDINNKFISSTLSVNKITKIEPGNWWVGMKDKNLQICIYGKDIALLNPNIDYPGVRITKVEKVQNLNYIFLYIEIDKDAKPGYMQIDFKKDNKSIIKYNYPLLERDSNPEDKKGFSSSDAMYLLMPDRFANGDPSNDSHPTMLEKVNRDDLNGRHGGDIKGIINNLDYISDLGFTALWSTPMMEDNLPTYSYHTYAISDYYNIDPRYGTNNDYKELSSKAKEKGIKLIMDVVTNHCSTEHYMVKDQPTQDWVHDKERCNFRIWTIQDPYASENDRNLNSCGWFDVTMADLNQRNNLLMDYLTQNSIWWIEFANLSGLRIDTYPYNYPDAMTTFNQRVMKEYPNLNIVGEVWMHEPLEIAYWQKDAYNKDGFNSELPSVMDFPLSDALNVFTKEEQGWESGIMHVYKNFTRDYLYTNPNNLLLFADNHDTERLWKTIDNNIDDYKLIFTILSTVRGIPQIYYGTEIMMSGIKELGDGDIRKDFPGGWPGDERNCFIESGRTKDENEVFNFTRKLLNWRKNTPVIHNGDTKHYLPQDNVYVFFRYNDTNKVMVIVNNNTKEISLDLSRFETMIGKNISGKEIIKDKEINLSNNLEISGKSSMIIELK